MNLVLPVSVGEALDKLTILHIKLECIKHSYRLIEVQKEYDILLDNLKLYVTKCIYHYELLKEINLDLWNKLDIQRNPEMTMEDFNIITKEIIKLNDARFRTKDKINNYCSSIIKEQKGYDFNTVYDICIDGNTLLEKDEKIFLTIKYILKKSVFFDKISVLITNNNDNCEFIKQYFTYDTSIEFKFL